MDSISTPPSRASKTAKKPKRYFSIFDSNEITNINNINKFRFQILNLLFRSYIFSWVKVLEMAELCLQLDREERLERFSPIPIHQFSFQIFFFSIFKSTYPSSHFPCIIFSLLALQVFFCHIVHWQVGQLRGRERS